MSQRNRAMKRENPGDSTLVYLIVGFVLFFIVSLIIHRYTPLFYQGWKVAFLPVVKAIDWVSKSVIGDLINPILGTTKTQTHALNQFISQTPVANWSVQGFIAMNHFIGQYLQIVLFPVGVYGTVFVFKNTQRLGGAFQHFKNSRLLNAYILSPEKRLNMGKLEHCDFTGVKTGALSCAQFCEKHNLITINEIENAANDIDVEVAFKVFSDQLGPRFSTRSEFFSGDYGWIAHFIIKHVPIAHRHEAIDYALEGHLYISTALLGLLDIARRFGVVPIQPFLRLKQQNRALWYAIASLGRKVSFVEGAGIVAQFDYENRFKQSMKELTDTTPMPEQVESAVNGLMQALIEESMELSSRDTRSLADHFDARTI